MKKKNLIIFTILFFFIVSFISYLKYANEKNISKVDKNISNNKSNNKEISEEGSFKKNTSDDETYKSNIMKNVSYSSKDTKGNEYTVNASQGEIDYDEQNIIYLTDVKAFIILTDSNNVTITSDYGKYNSNNLDTIFSKNVVINYLENKITGEYLDFSMKRNSMIISRNVVYTNLENILKADVIEMDITTKDTKIFMFQDDKKVNIKNKD